MKRKNRESGFLRSATGFFTRNFGLKLLSLSLALILYGVLSPEAGTEPQAILPMVKPAEIQSIVMPKHTTNTVAKVEVKAVDTNAVAKVEARAFDTNAVAKVEARAFDTNAVAKAATKAAISGTNKTTKVEAKAKQQNHGE